MQDPVRKVREIAGQLLDSGQVEGVLGLCEQHGSVGPCLFQSKDDLAALILEPKYSLANVCRLIQARFPSTLMTTSVTSSC